MELIEIENVMSVYISRRGPMSMRLLPLGLMEIENSIRYTPQAVGLIYIESRHTGLAVGLKPRRARRSPPAQAIPNNHKP